MSWDRAVTVVVRAITEFDAARKAGAAKIVAVARTGREAIAVLVGQIHAGVVVVAVAWLGVISAVEAAIAVQIHSFARTVAIVVKGVGLLIDEVVTVVVDAVEGLVCPRKHRPILVIAVLFRQEAISIRIHRQDAVTVIVDAIVSHIFGQWIDRRILVITVLASREQRCVSIAIAVGALVAIAV